MITNNNPSISFFRKYEKSILKTREILFGELNSISSDFATEARDILEKKIKSNSNKPLMGELFPWIINDLVCGNRKYTYKTSVGWLAIYLYTIFLDEYVDCPRPILPSKFITASILAKTGLLKIGSITFKTPYEKYINRAFSFSAFNQNLDVKLQKDITANFKIKSKYSEGKNYIILACAGALAAQNNNHGKFITQFTKTILLALQYLDDMKDYDEDIRSRNYTVLWNYALQDKVFQKTKIQNASKKEFLSELIASGALYRVVKKTSYLINQSILLTRNYKIYTKSSKASVHFLNLLNSALASFEIYLKNNYVGFNYLPTEKQHIILDKVEKHLEIVAQSS